MTSSQIRQSFLDYFAQRGHTIVPSSSLLPDAPNLLFTNAGMNQFVPIFLGERKPDVSKWPGVVPGLDTRAADTQKCIRAGGKHNDLEDVGLDTYHHTFFEMLGNWSFGDYFKKEAIAWAWELVTSKHWWGFPKQRLYATVYQPGPGDPSEFDQEAYDHWARLFEAAGLDPKIHIVFGGKKDNFWMMGDTGPCGPCSELHVDLTPKGDSRGALVNQGSPLCIEIWNLVFIQFNANADGTFTPLPAKHVDTGAGFERVSAIIQCTKNFTDFSGIISNYETDIFRPLFDRLEQLSGKRYGSTLPAGQSEISNPQSQIALDVAFRVIADHIRCLSFGIADGILPGNEGRGYVLRRILRRAVRYGRFLGFHEPFFYKLVDVLARTMGDVFPEVRRRQTMIEKILRAEEENFNRTLDRGIELLDQAIAECQGGVLDAVTAFKLYDTYGFPLDLTELMCREQGLKVDVTGFERLMEQQRERARRDHERKKTAITVADEGLQIEPTKFIGYDHLEAEALVEAVAPGAQASSFEIILDRTPFYAEMGGQVGDTGLLHVPGHDWSELGRLEVTDTQRHGELHVHRARLVSGRAPEVGEGVRVAVDAARRANIQRHHTATHLFHWALHEVVSREARQRGSLVAPDRMRFDFNHHEHLTPQQIADIERLVNERIRENAPVYGFEVPYRDIKGNPKVMQFFGEKYGDVVRVIQIGGHPGRFDGFALELCGGTHTRNTGDIGAFKIARESAIAAGVRRVEAAAGQFALELIEKLQAHEQKEAELAKARELEKEQAKERQARMQREAPAIAAQLVAKAAQAGGIRVVTGNLGDANTELLRLVVDALKPVLPSGIAVLGGVSEGKVCLIGYVTPDLVKQGKHAGKIVGAIAKLCGGGGGGRPDLAQAGGKDPAKLDEALRAVAGLVG